MLYKVHTPFVDPFVFNRLRRGEPFIVGVAIDARTAEIDRVRYSLGDESAVTLVPGEQVHLLMYNGFFHIETAREYEQMVLQKLAEKWSNKLEEER